MERSREKSAEAQGGGNRVKKSGAPQGTRTAIIMLVMVVLVLGYYSYLSGRNAKKSEQSMEESVASEMTPVQEVIAKSKYKEYPATAVQVLKYYNEITSCFYNEKYSDDELEQLAALAQDLYDTELITSQTWDSYISNLKYDIDTFRKGNITIYKSEVTPATDVEYFEHGGYECARLYCVYTLKSGPGYQTSKEVFILRKDDAGHWKIYGFELIRQRQNLEAG